MSRDIHKVILALSDESRPISYQLLRNLSELNTEELRQLQTAWLSLSGQRSHELLRALVSLAEEHVEYNYYAIFDWLMGDDDPRNRVLAIEGLWEDMNPRHLERLREIVMQDEDVEVRAAAAMALGRFVHWGEMGEIAARYGEDAVAVLWDVYHDPREHVHVRRRALEGIAASSHAGAARLIENAHYNEDLFMRVSALYAMGRTADVRWIPYLLPELSSQSPELRMEAARALGELEAIVAIDPLIRMLDTEKDSEVRFAILEALGQIGGDKAKRALQLAADSEDEAEAEIAEMALEQLYAGINNLYELIDEVVLGAEPMDEDVYEGDASWEAFYEDPLDAEIRRLLDDEGDRF